MKIYVGIDIGTTSTKVCAFSTEGEMLEECLREYPLLHPAPGAAIQEVETVLSAIEDALKSLVGQCDGYDIQGFGISAAMHSVVLLDEQKRPLTPIITWADTRASVAEFSEKQKLALLQRTGTPVHPMSPLVKLRYLAQDEGNWKKMRYVSDLKSLLVNRLTTAGLLLDTQLASATGLLGLKTLDWDDEALEIAQISPKQLPELVSPTTRLNWKPEVAEQLGFSAEIPLFIGGSDGCLANLGSKIFRTNEVAMSIGTSGAVRTTHQQAEIDPELGLFNYHLLEDYYVMGGATNNGAKLLDWLFEFFKGHYGSIKEMVAAAEKANCDDGLKFTPYLYGERAPIYDALATATFSGMRGHHKPAQYVRAVIEGITDNLLQILDKLETAGGTPEKILASGGFTRSPWWVDLFSERSGYRFETADTAQASAYGAALIARIGLGEVHLKTGRLQTAE